MSATATMLPPRPPSPPSGPPRGTNFSRRNEALPSPPFPAMTSMRASSKNFMAWASEIKKPRSSSGALWCGCASRLLLHRLDRHGGLGLGTVLRVLHVAGGLREERVVLADAHVHAGVELRAALTNEDRARVH